MGQVITSVLTLVLPALDSAQLAAAVLTVAAVLVAALLAAGARERLVLPAPTRAAVAENAERTAYLSLRDPAAPGRPRPRAPGL